ncbi:MAG: alpha-L-rhamnosidase C-terminal domain-containing protein [Cyclobacteriaceae bacterium]
MKSHLILSLFFCLLLVSCKVANDDKPTDLMVDLLTAPQEAVITNAKPSFSWVVNDALPGAKQTAFQIIVANSKAALENKQADVWDSNKVPSNQSISVAFAGNDLLPDQMYFWKVRTWNEQDKASQWSEIQRFYTGTFNAQDLKWPGESRWVKQGSGNSGNLVFENRHAIRYQDFSPLSLEKNQAGNFFVAFEKGAFATLKIRLENAKDGDTLVVHLGEKRKSTPEVDRDPGGSITYKQVLLPLSAGISDYTISLPRQFSKYPNSQVLEAHMPEVAAFRYAEIEGWQGNLQKTQVKQHALLYRFNDEASFFTSSNDNLNQIWELSKHTLKVTPFLGLYIDGTRERMPYEADAYVQQISHYCVDREFAIQRYTTEFLIFNPSWPTEWHLHMVMMAWADYMATGDQRLLEKYYEELKKKSLLALARADGLISTRSGLVTESFLASIHYYGDIFGDIVDWPKGTPANEDKLQSGFGSISLEGETDRYVYSEINTVVNAFHYRNLVLLEQIAKLIGKHEDADFYQNRAQLVKKSFNEKLLSKKTGLYVDGENVEHSALHANMFPVAFGLAPKENYPVIRDFLISKGMACSPFGAPYLFDALYELGAMDYALELLTSESDRSWMNMIHFGTTITSEAWDLKYKRNMTWNHAWGASPTYIITRKIFGIEALEPAYRKILIKPQPGKLKSAELISPTIRGAINAKFNHAFGRDFSLDLELPANTTANVLLPVFGHSKVSLQVNGENVEGFNNLDGFVRIDSVGSGRYNFTLRFHESD